MAAGLAEERYAQDPSRGPVAICDREGMPRWNPVWQGNPAVWTPVAPLRRFREPYVIAGKGCLPYLQYPFSASEGWRFSAWRVRDHRPHLYLTGDELELGAQLKGTIGPYIILEPTAQRKAVNRRPPMAFWPELLTGLQRTVGYRIVQLQHAEADLLDRVVWAPHRDFRDACGILASASLLIATEGGLAHAAAALGIPAVILWGGCVSVENLGYPEQTNLVDPSPETPCGQLYSCDHCTRAWERLTPETVLAAVHQTLVTSVHDGLS